MFLHFIIHSTKYIITPALNLVKSRCNIPARLLGTARQAYTCTAVLCTAIGCHWLHSLGSRHLPSNLAAIAVMFGPNDSVARGCRSGPGALQLCCCSNRH